MFAVPDTIAYDLWMDLPDEIKSYYGQGGELERLERGTGLLEAERTKELIAQFLPERATVLDVGGGPGYYAEWLAGRGHTVHLIDPVPLHVETARHRAGDPPCFTVELGDARELKFADGEWDTVLLLGPLYHLPDRADRLAAWNEARRVCRPGGWILAAAISRFAPALNGIRVGWIADEALFETVRMQLERGWWHGGDHPGFPSAFFHYSDELVEEAEAADLTVQAVYGIEGPGWLVGDFDEKWADPVMRERLLWLARTTEQDPRMRAVSDHLLLVANKPI